MKLMTDDEVFGGGQKLLSDEEVFAPLSDEEVGIKPPGVLSAVVPALKQAGIEIKEGWQDTVNTLAAAETLALPEAQRLIRYSGMPSLMLADTSPQAVAKAGKELIVNRRAHEAEQAKIDAAAGERSTGVFPTLREAAVDVTTNVARNVPALTAAAVLPNKLGIARAVVPLISGGVQAGAGAEYDTLKGGGSYFSANLTGDTSAVAESGFEFLPVARLLKDLGTAKTVQLVANYIVGETATELPTTALQDIAQYVGTYDGTKTLDEFAKDFITGQVRTAITTPFAAGTQGAIVKGVDVGAGKVGELFGRGNNNTTPEQIPPNTPPLTPQQTLEKVEQLTTAAGIPLNSAGVDATIAEAQSAIDDVLARLEAGETVEDFSGAAADALVVAQATPETSEGMVEASVFTNPLVKGLDSVGQVVPDTGQSNDVLGNENNWVDPNDAVPRAERRVVRTYGAPEGIVGQRWGDVDVGAFDAVTGPIVLQVGEDSEVRDGVVLDAAAKDIYDLALEFNPTGRYVILPETAGRGKQGTYFYHKGVHYITPRHLNMTTPDRQGNARTAETHNWNARQEFVSSLAHEFGHSLIIEKILEGVTDRATAAMIAGELQAGEVSAESLGLLHPVVAKLVTDWMTLRDQILGDKISLEEAAARWFSPTKLANNTMLRDRLRDIRRKKRSKPYTAFELFEAVGGAENWLSFNEFLAEQMPKYMHWSKKWGKTNTARTLKVGNISAASIADFFADVLQKMQQIFNRKSQDAFVKPLDSYIKWLEHLGHVTTALENLDTEMLDTSAEAAAQINWDDPTTTEKVQTALTGLFRSGEIDAEDYKKYRGILTKGDPFEALDFVEGVLGGKLQFDRIGGRPAKNLNVFPSKGFAFTTLEHMPRSEKVTRQALEAAAKKASARPTELEFLLRPLGKRAAMPEAEYFLALHGQLPELTVESIPRFSEVGLAQVGMFDALGTTWSVNGTEALEIQAHRGFPFESLGHFRLIEDGDTTVIAEVQSNVFQEWAARSAADPDVLKPLAWMREVWEQVWVQVAVKKAVARGTRKIRFPTAETLPKLQTWDAEALDANSEIMKRYAGRIPKYLRHRYGAQLSPDGMWWEFSADQEHEDAAVVPFGESGQAAPYNVLPSNGSLMFDRTTEEGATTASVWQKLKRFAPDELRAHMKAIWKTGNLLTGFLQIQQQAHLYPHIRGLQSRRNDSARYEETKNAMLYRAYKVADRLGMVGPTRIKDLFNLTREEMSTNQQYTDLVKTASGWEHVPTERLFEALRKHNIDPLTEEGKNLTEIYLEAKNAIQVQMDRLEKVLIDLTWKKYSKSPEAVQHRELARVISSFRELRTTAYWPQQRYGEYHVRVRKTVEGKLVTVYHEAFDTSEEQLADYYAQQKRWGKGVTYARETLTHGAAIVRMLPADFIDDAVELLGLEDADAQSLEALAQGKGPDAEKFFDSRDKYAKGGSTDFFRNFSDFTNHTGSLIAKMEYRSRFKGHIAEMKEQIREVVKKGGPTAAKEKTLMERIVREMEAHDKNMFSPTQEFHTTRAIISLLYLSFNVAVAALNFMTLANTYGYIAMQVGAVEAADIMAKAVADGIAHTRNHDWAKTPEDAQLRQVLEAAYERGVINQAYSYALAGQASSNIMRRLASTSLLGKSMRVLVDTVGMYAFRKTEAGLRIVTLLATARMRQKSGKYNTLMGTQELFEDAANDTRLMAGLYSAGEKPRFLAGRGMSLITIFMTYAQLMVFHAYGGIEVGMRRQAKINGDSIAAHRSYSAYILLLYLALSGLEGLPGFESLLDIMSGVFRLFGWSSDIRKDMREFVRDVVGVNPNLAMHGVLHDLGGFDISGRVGMGRVIPGADRVFNPDADTAAEYYGSLGLSLFGVAGGTMKAIWDMQSRLFEQIGVGLPTSTIAMNTLEKFPGFVGGAASGAKWATMGARGPAGGLVLSDEFGRPRLPTTTEVLVKTLTKTNPTELNVRNEETFQRRGVVQYWQMRQSALLQAWKMVTVMTPEEPAAREDVLREIQHFNTELGKEGPAYVKAFGIRNLSSYTKRYRKEANKEASGRLTGDHKLMHRELAPLYEDAPPPP